MLWWRMCFFWSGNVCDLSVKEADSRRGCMPMKSSNLCLQPKGVPYTCTKCMYHMPVLQACPAHL